MKQMNIDCLVLTLLAAVHAGEGKLCSQSLLWEMCPCFLLPAATKRLHVSGCQHSRLMSTVEVKDQQIYLVNGRGELRKEEQAKSWEQIWSFYTTDSIN